MAEKEKRASKQTQEAIYARALSKLEADKLTVQFAYKAANLEQAAELFEAAGAYQDAEKLAAECREMAAKAREDGRKDQLQRAASRAKIAKKDDEWAKVQEMLEQVSDLPEAHSLLEEVQQKRAKGHRRHAVKRTVWLAILAVILISGGMLNYSGGARYMLGRLFEAAGMRSQASYEFRNAKGFADAEDRLEALSLRTIYEAAVGKQITYGTQKWVVLDRDEERMLLIASDLTVESILYGLPFNTTPGETTWADSSLREYLNGEFLETVFTEEERSHLLPVTSEAEFNYHYDTGYDETVTDYVTILSPTELGLYRQAVEGLGQTWWLRAPGSTMETVQFTTPAHQAMSYGYPADHVGMFTRAVIALDMAYLEEAGDSE